MMTDEFLRQDYCRSVKKRLLADLNQFEIRKHPGLGVIEHEHPVAKDAFCDPQIESVARTVPRAVKHAIDCV